MKPVNKFQCPSCGFDARDLFDYTGRKCVNCGFVYTDAKAKDIMMHAVSSKKFN